MSNDKLRYVSIKEIVGIYRHNHCGHVIRKTSNVLNMNSPVPHVTEECEECNIINATFELIDVQIGIEKKK